MGFVSGTATVADEIDNINTLRQYKYNKRQNKDEIEQHVDFFSTDRDIWRRPVKVRGALLGLGGDTAAYEKKCGDRKDSQQEVHSRVKSGGGRCGGGRCGRGSRGSTSCGNYLCGNGFKFFLCPRVFAVATGGADCLDIIGGDRHSCIAPLGADIGKD